MFNMYNKNEHLSSSSHSSDSSNNEYSIDRSKTCPFLLRIFYKVNGYNSLRNFSGDNFPPELDIYTWEDANLKELANFIHKALKDTVLGMYDYYKFSRIHYDMKGTLLSDEIGAVVIKDKKSRLNYNEKKALKDIKVIKVVKVKKVQKVQKGQKVQKNQILIIMIIYMILMIILY